MDTKEIAERTLGMCKKAGAQNAEVAVSHSKNVSVSAQDNEIHVATSDKGSWLGVRVINSHSQGFSCVNSFEDSKVQMAIEEAMAIAKSSPPDDSNVLPDPGETISIGDLHNQSLAEMGLDKVVGYAKQMLLECKTYDSRISVDMAKFNLASTVSTLANTKGINLSQERTGIFYFVYGMAKEGETVSSMDGAFGATTDPQKINVSEVARKFSKNVIESLGAKSGKSFEGPVILFGDALSELILSTVLWSCNANSIQMGESRFAGMQGKQVASEKLSILDDGRRPGRFESTNFDREGIAPKIMWPIKNGIFTEPFHNARTAARDKTISNGHAAGSPSSTPSVSTTNIIVETGKTTLEELIADTKLGLLVKRYSGNFDPSSGDFSGVIKGGYLIENGKITTPLLGTMIAGNVFEMIKNISGISSDVEDLITTITPSIRFEGIKVTSQ